MDVLTQLQQRHRGQKAPARFVYVAYDQLHRDLGALKDADPADTGVLLVESADKGRRRPYHKQKLAWVLANQRHFALELADAGFFVDLRFTPGPYAPLLRTVAQEHGPLTMTAPAERELRAELAPLVEDGALTLVPHDGWLTTEQDFQKGAGRPFRMDRFYRHVRKRTGVLMDEQGKPVGGRFSFDGENREPYRPDKGAPPPPPPLRFAVDDVKREVKDLIETHYADHPGVIDLDRLAASADDHAQHLAYVQQHCLTSFGPYEDAMHTDSAVLFHTLLSAPLNLHRILPAAALTLVLEADIPLNSKEGFVRQLIGWREYVRHVHRVTDGFRTGLDVGHDDTRHVPDAGYFAWRDQPSPAPLDPAFAGARPQAMQSHTDLPPAYWGQKSGLHCLDHVVGHVWQTGYSHHITRLMVLSNIAMLLDVDPRQLTDWFWVMYIDAYDWVVEPNVLGMGTYAAGEVMTTKPYVAGSGYIKKMSNFCSDCAFHPQKTCPLPHLYWAYLDRHQDALQDNQRVAIPLASLKKRDPAKKHEDRAVFERTLVTLGKGERLTPA